MNKPRRRPRRSSDKSGPRKVNPRRFKAEFKRRLEAQVVLLDLHEDEVFNQP